MESIGVSNLNDAFLPQNSFQSNALDLATSGNAPHGTGQVPMPIFPLNQEAQKTDEMISQVEWYNRNSIDIQTGSLGEEGGPLTSVSEEPASSSGRRSTSQTKNSEDIPPRAAKNRESAARSRARRQEYKNSLEAQVAALQERNRSLREMIIRTAKAPEDPHAGKLDGEVLRRTRSPPL